MSIHTLRDIIDHRFCGVIVKIGARRWATQGLRIQRVLEG